MDDTHRDGALVAYAGAIRLLSPSARQLFDDVPRGHEVIGGLGVVFDDPGSPQGDLDGLFFTRETYLGPHKGNGVRLTFNHTVPALVEAGEARQQARLDAFARELAEHRFGAIRTMETDKGLYFEALLDMADEYEEFVASLAATETLGASSATASHLARLRNADGEIVGFFDALQAGYGEMLAWDIIEMAVTPIPSEPRTRGVQPLRSLPQPTLRLRTGDAPGGDDDEAVRTIHIENHGTIHIAGAGWPASSDDDDAGDGAAHDPEDEAPRAMNPDQIRRLIARYDAADDAAKEALRVAILEAVPAGERADLPDEVAARLSALEAQAPAVPEPATPEAEKAGGDGAAGITAEQLAGILESQRTMLREELDAARVPAFRPGQSLPSDQVAIHRDLGTARYENTETVDLMCMAEVLFAGHRRGHGDAPSPDLYRALAERMTSDETRRDPNLNQSVRAFQRFARTYGFDPKTAREADPGLLAHAARHAQQRWGSDNAWRANELMGSTVTNGGDEWIGVGYSNQLWEDIYNDRMVVQRLMPQEWPWPGAESGTDPIIDSDVTVYLAGQTTDLSASPGGIPVGTVTESKLDTGNRSHTLRKLGARTIWTGELTEDSILPFAATLRSAMTRAAAEHLESAIIDGDTATATTTNINDIAGTPGGTEYFLAFDGFRKLGLVTNTANSVSVGTLDETSFTAVRKLLGTGGNRGLAPDAFSYVMDTNTYYKAIDLDAVKTRSERGDDGTIIRGTLPDIYGTEIIPSAFMHLVGDFTSGKLANTAGKIDQDTAGNNTTGSLVAVLWRLWKFYWRRRITVEVQRFSFADATDIVLFLRASLTNRDNDAASIGYNVTV